MAQTVLITGGSRGIGAACVRTFAENGWNIAFTYSKSREAADRLAGETGALALLADQQDTAAVELAAAEVKARFGTIDAVVCNAGIAEQKLFQNITDADWMRMLDVNLMGTVRTIRAVLPEMLHNHKGSIVTVSSMWGGVRRVLREPLFREQGCDYRPEQVARAGAWPEQYPGQLHCAGRDRHRHECHAQCGYHAGACRSDTARKSRRGSRGRGQHSVSVLG